MPYFLHNRLVLTTFSLLMLVVSTVGCSQGGDSIAPDNSQEQGFGPGDYELSVAHGGLDRKYLVHAPVTNADDPLLPVVFAIHGGGGTAEGAVDYFQLNSKSDSEKFIVVYPQGTGEVVNGDVLGAWNAGTCCSPATENSVDDAGFFRAMIQQLKMNFNVDNQKIYAMGMSNGGMMSYKLACELSDVITAIAAAGAPGVFESCNPSRAVPIMHFHGVLDPCSLYFGGPNTSCMGKFLQGLGFPIVPEVSDREAIPAHLQGWSQRNACLQQTQITYQNANATCETYQGCQDGAEVTLCTVENMGHTWPGHTEYSLDICQTQPNGFVCSLWKATVGPLSQDIAATDEIWEFFNKHTLAN